MLCSLPLVLPVLQKTKILLRPAPLDPRDFFGKLPKLAAAAAAHATASPATAATTAADAEAGAAALASFGKMIGRVAAGGGAGAGAAPVVWVFAHAYGAAPPVWAAVLATLPPGVTVKFVALPSGLPPASAAGAGLALARFGEEAVAAAEAASLTLVRCDPASLRAALLSGLLRDLVGSAPLPLRLRLPGPIGGVTDLACLAQSELAPLCAPSITAGGPACPCHGAPVWVDGATPAYPAGVCPVSGRGVRLDGCGLNPRLLRVGAGGPASGGIAPLTLALTHAAASAAGDLVLHPPGGGVLGWGCGDGGGGGGGGNSAAGPAFPSPATPTLHVVACVPAASLEAGALHGVPCILLADPLADEEEEDEEEEGMGVRAHPPPRRAWPRGGPRRGDPFAGPTSSSDEEEAPGLAPSPRPPSLLPAPGVPALAALCAALRGRGDALVAAGRVDLVGGGAGAARPTSLVRYFALRPAAESPCLLVVGLAGDEERLPLSFVLPPGGGRVEDAALADAAAALDAVRIEGGVGGAALATGLRGRLAALAARTVAKRAAVPPLPPLAGAGGEPPAPPPQQQQPATAGRKRRKPLAAAAALCMAAPAARE